MVDDIFYSVFKDSQENLTASFILLHFHSVSATLPTDFPSRTWAQGLETYLAEAQSGTSSAGLISHFFFILFWR